MFLNYYKYILKSLESLEYSKYLNETIQNIKNVNLVYFRSHWNYSNLNLKRHFVVGINRIAQLKIYLKCFDISI